MKPSKNTLKTCFDSFKKTNSKEDLDRIIFNLKSSVSFDLQLSPKDIKILLTKDDNDTTLLKHILDNHLLIDDKTLNSIKEDPIIFKELISMVNYYDFNLYIKPDDLKKMIDGKTVFEYLLDRQPFIDKSIMYQFRISDDRTINAIYDKNPKLLNYLDSFDIMYRKVKGERIIEFLIRTNNIDPEILENIISEELVSIIRKYKREDLLAYLNGDILYTYIDGELLVETLLKKGITIKTEILYLDYYERLMKHESYEGFNDLSEYTLLSKYNSNLTFLERLLQKGYVVKQELESKESLEILSKYNCYEKMTHFNLDDLLTNRDLNETYLEQLIKAYKEGKIDKININTFISKPKNVAKMLCLYADNNVRELTPNISLLSPKDGTTLLDELIKIDRLDAVDDEELEDFNVAVHLRMRGIKNTGVEMTVYSKNATDDYIEEKNERFYRIEGNNKRDKVIYDRIFSLFLNDGKSDPEIVNLLYRSYIHLLKINYVEGSRELEKLYEIKTKCPNFSIQRSETTDAFDYLNDAIYLTSNNINVINHEFGHALYYYLSESEYSEEFESLIEGLRNDPSFLERVSKFSEFVHLYSDKAEKQTEEIMSKYSSQYSNLDYHKKVERFLKKSKKERKEKYGSGFNNKTVLQILDDIYTFDEYIKQDKRINKKELLSAILSNEYVIWFCVSDMIDAIYKGKFCDNALRNSNGEVLKCMHGHGIKYYNRFLTDSISEVMAHLSCILKSPYREEGLKLIEEYIGKEFLDFIMKRYYIEIVNSDTIKRKGGEYFESRSFNFI